LEELVKILREKIELDAGFVEIVKKIVEDPERLRGCYV
jgi:2-hydroxy-3-keto-5-methylthiopentenyl-1-phosphate phosphatase